jgi:hypothetical protein
MARSTRKRRRDDAPEALSRLTFRLSPEAAKRLAVTCAMDGRRHSTIVEGLILQHLPNYVVSLRERGGGPPPPGGAGAGGAAPDPG